MVFLLIVWANLSIIFHEWSIIVFRPGEFMVFEVMYHAICPYNPLPEAVREDAARLTGTGNEQA